MKINITQKDADKLRHCIGLGVCHVRDNMKECKSDVIYGWYEDQERELIELDQYIGDQALTD